MNNGEVIDLLTLITAYDGRNPGEADLRTWGDAAQRGRWTWDEAADAVKAHFAESTQWLMPGHVTQRVRAKRSEPPRSKTLPSATPRPAEAEHVRRVVEWLAGRMATDRETRAGDGKRALAVACPHCHAEPNSACVQTIGPSGKRRDGYRSIDVPHLQRRQAYRRFEE